MKTLLRYACLFSLSFLLSGCSPKLTDNLPRDTPKGYVEFYLVYLPPLNYDSQYRKKEVYELVKGEEIFIVQIGRDSGNIHERIAFVPGDHTFIIRLTLGTEKIDRIVKVPVQEDIVIPVRLDVSVRKNWQTSEGGTTKFVTTEYSIIFDPHVEEAIPIKKK